MDIARPAAAPSQASPNGKEPWLWTQSQTTGTSSHVVRRHRIMSKLRPHERHGPPAESRLDGDDQRVPQPRTRASRIAPAAFGRAVLLHARPALPMSSYRREAHTDAVDVPYAAAHPNRPVLVEPHIGAIRRIALAFCRTQSDADDLAQEALLKAYRSLKTFDGKGPIAPWLYAVTRSVFEAPGAVLMAGESILAAMVPSQVPSCLRAIQNRPLLRMPNW